MEKNFFHLGFSQNPSFPFPGAGDTCQIDSSSIDTMFSGVSLLSLLTSNPDFDFFSSVPQLQHHHNLLNPHPDIPSSFNPHSVSPSVSGTFGFFPDPGSSQTLKLPKLEPSLGLASDDSPVFSQPPFNFMHTDSLLFHRLPDLLSLDVPADSSTSIPALLPPFHKRRRLDEDVDAAVAAASASASSSSSPPVMVVPRSSALARQRRQKLSDKTRYLQKLLPWDKKMNIATMLEEAYKYVKFLQAQLAALHAMPSRSSLPNPVRGDDDLSSVFGVLGRLNRNQLLQVLVNSPVAQTLLSSQGCCVFSVEQLDMLKKLTPTRMTRTSSLHQPKSFSQF